MSSIIVNNLHKSFKSNHVLSGLSFECHNEIVFVAGLNGAGKTTLIRLALNLEFADKGTVSLINDYEKPLEDGIGVVFDTPCLYRKMTCKQNIGIFCTGYLDDKKHMQKVLDNLNIDSVLMRKNVDDCSFGQQHRVNVAIALIRKPTILFLDEPTIGLDPISWELIKDSIIQNKNEQGGCVVITGQDYHELGQMADKLLILRDGKSQYYGTVDDFVSLQDEKSLKDALYPNLRNGGNV